MECWKSIRLLKDDDTSYPHDCLVGVVEGYPFHSEPSSIPTKLEEYYLDVLYQRPRGVAATLSSTLPLDSKGNKTPSLLKHLIPLHFSHLRRGNLVRKHHQIKPVVKGLGNTSAILCDVPTYVDFLELSLCMHAYLHYSTDLPPDVRRQTDVFEIGVRHFIKLFSTFFYRGDASVDTDTCKIHCFMHCLTNTSKYGDPMQYESGKGERGLKEWAKSVAQTAQKIGLDIFLYQTIMRVADRLLLSAASNLLQRQTKTDVGNTKVITKKVWKRKVPHYRFYKTESRLVSVNRMGKESPCTGNSTTISANVLTALRKIEKDLDVIDIWCEVKLPRTKDVAAPQLLRAHPSLDKFGAFYDWVDADFELEVNSDDDSLFTCNDESNVAPSKLLAFYTDTEGEDVAIVHSVEWTQGRETSLGNTRLITNHCREFQVSGWPAIRKIKLQNILRPLYVIEQKKNTGALPPRPVSSSLRKEYIVSVIRPRTDWATIFYHWAKTEVSPLYTDATHIRHCNYESGSDTDSGSGSDEGEP